MASTISGDVGGLVTATGLALSAAGFGGASDFAAGSGLAGLAAAGALVGGAVVVLPPDGAHAANAMLAMASSDGRSNPLNLHLLAPSAPSATRRISYPFRPVVRIPSLKYF